MAPINNKSVARGAAILGLVIGLWFVIGLSLQSVGAGRLAFYVMVWWKFLVFPHDLVIYTVSGPRVLPGLVAPAVAILQWSFVALVVGFSTRNCQRTAQFVLAGVAVVATGFGIYLTIFMLLGFDAAFP